ncbi:MAG: sensor histidine kinase [Anaerolineales bacterium]|jgi:signal transduction histidine kinase
MATASFSIVLLLVYFVYGLAFFSLGMALTVEGGRSPAMADAQILRPLAIFGLLHGTHEWLEAYLMQSEAYGVTLPAWLSWFRLFLLIISFFFLIIFGIMVFKMHASTLGTGAFILLGILGVYVLFILINAYLAIRSPGNSWFDLLNALARYLLAVPGAILAAFALRVQAVQSTGDERRHLVTHLTIAAVGFFIYGLTQLFVSKVNMFPARFINTTDFSLWFGIPIQAVRAVVAVTITLGMVRVTQLAESSRQHLAAAVQKERLEALEQRDSLRHELLVHTVQAQEEERTRIARELHDETAQVLTAFSLNLATLRTYISIVPETTPMVDRLQALCKQMSQDLYRLVHDLRPAQLDDLGLIPAIQYLKDSSALQGLDVSLEVEGKNRRLDSIVETVLFRVVQEALNNVLRHAQARQAHVLIQFSPQEIILKISDSGIGFSPELSLNPPHGWGLAGMRERVDLIGGQLKIGSEPGRGVIVEVTVPDMGLSAPPNGGL